MKREEKHTAIIAAAGRGNRMNSDIPKQFLELCGKPVLYYSLKAFEESFVDEIVLVTSEADTGYCREQIVERYGFTKVSKIIQGGAERYESVYKGLIAAEDADYVYIHDGARPFVTAQIINDARKYAEKYGACAAGMPVKDTIKIVDAGGLVTETPPRRCVWQVQTPQAFSYDVIREAYDLLMRGGMDCTITDDTQVVEEMFDRPIKLFFASYENIKITTPEDMMIAESLMKQRKIKK